MNDKPFKSHDELIELLECRGIDFSKPDSKSFANKKLQRIGYYNLINGYGSLFLEEKDKFKSGTTVKEIYNLYLFDQKLREIFLHNILPFEANIKSLIAYHFPQEQMCIRDSLNTISFIICSTSDAVLFIVFAISLKSICVFLPCCIIWFIFF